METCVSVCCLFTELTFRLKSLQKVIVWKVTLASVRVLLPRLRGTMKAMPTQSQSGPEPELRPMPMAPLSMRHDTEGNFDWARA